MSTLQRSRERAADYPLGLLKRLNQSVQKNPIKTTVGKFDVILMMLAEGVHRLLLCGEIPGTSSVNASATLHTTKGYQGRRPCLVSRKEIPKLRIPAGAEIVDKIDGAYTGRRRHGGDPVRVSDPGSQMCQESQRISFKIFIFRNDRL